MSETKFTPAPWEACDVGDYADFDGKSRVIVGDDTRIAVVHHGGSAENRAECDANAHLIAAAPKLYEALKRLRDSERIGANPELDEARDFADATLREARGEDVSRG